MLSGMSVKRANAVSGGGTLDIDAQASSDLDPNAPYFSQAGHRINSSGSQQYLNASGSWLNANAGVSWIDDFGGNSAGDYECMCTTPSGSGGTLSGTFGTWQDCDVTRSWTISLTTTGSIFRTSTLTVREKADTGNSASALVTWSLDNNPF